MEREWGTMKEEGKRVAVLYLITVVVYGAAAFLFTSTVHIDVDEELYMALAKSFHYNGEFAYGGQLLNYNCVLYSMLISLAYFFYTPEKILFFMRLIGVIMMCSAVFPIFLIARDWLENSRKALFFAGFMMIMPYMFDSAYLMQEVLSYPLFLWTVYFLDRFFCKKIYKKNFAFLVAGAVFSVLCVFTKTYMFFIPVVVNLCTLYYLIKGEEKGKYIAGTAVYDGIYLLLFGGMYLMVYAVNGFRQGSNHYASQISHLFPLSVNTIIFGLMGCVIYGAFFVVNTGVLPVGSIIYEWKEKGGKPWSLTFLSASVVFLVIEIVFMIVLTEEGANSLPHKFLFRYFQIFVPLILIISFKNKEKGFAFLESRKIKITIWTALCVVLAYFTWMKGNTRQAIIDGHLFLLIENITKYIIPYGDVVSVLFLMALMGIVQRIYIKGTGNLEKIVKTGIIGVGVFWFIQLFQLPYYTNYIAEGKVIQNESIKIAQYLNEHDYEYIYYVYGNGEEKRSYLRNFYGYVKQPYQIIEENSVEQALEEGSGRKAAMIFPNGTLMNLEGWSEAEIGTEKLALYIQ